MIGDWIIIVILGIIYIIMIIIGFLIFNGANGLTISLRITDNKLKEAYSVLKYAGFLIIFVGFFGILILIFSIIKISVKSFNKRINDFLHRYSEIIIKELYAFGTIFAVIFSGIQLIYAGNLIENSRTYKLIKIPSVKSEFDIAISSINLAAYIMFILSAIIGIIFIVIIFYDLNKMKTKIILNEVNEVEILNPDVSFDIKNNIFEENTQPKIFNNDTKPHLFINDIEPKIFNNNTQPQLFINDTQPKKFINNINISPNFITDLEA